MTAAPLGFWIGTDVEVVTTRYVVISVFYLGSLFCVFVPYYSSVSEGNDDLKNCRFSKDIQLVDMNLPLQILTAAQSKKLLEE